MAAAVVILFSQLGGGGREPGENRRIFRFGGAVAPRPPVLAKQAAKSRPGKEPNRARQARIPGWGDGSQKKDWSGL
jgi:hypothetical protein